MCAHDIRQLVAPERGLQASNVLKKRVRGGNMRQRRFSGPAVLTQSVDACTGLSTDVAKLAEFDMGDSPYSEILGFKSDAAESTCFSSVCESSALDDDEHVADELGQADPFGLAEPAFDEEPHFAELAQMDPAGHARPPPREIMVPAEFVQSCCLPASTVRIRRLGGAEMSVDLNGVSHIPNVAARVLKAVGLNEFEYSVTLLHGGQELTDTSWGELRQTKAVIDVTAVIKPTTDIWKPACFEHDGRAVEKIIKGTVDDRQGFAYEIHYRGGEVKKVCGTPLLDSLFSTMRASKHHTL